MGTNLHGDLFQQLDELGLEPVDDFGASSRQYITNQPLDKQVQHALVEWDSNKPTSSKFLPNNELQRLLQPHLVQQFLKDTFKTKNDDASDLKLDQLVEYICGKRDASESERDKNAARRVFALLAILGKSNCVKQFQEAGGIRDSHLPLHRRSNRRGIILFAQEEHERRLRCFDENWSGIEKDMFYSYQQCLLSPYLHLAENGKVAFYHLPAGTILPWTSRQVQSPYGRSSVSKVIIHPAHNGLSPETEPEMDNSNEREAFALKIVNSKEEFYAELKTIRKATPHPHIPRLVCAFAFDESPQAYGLLFPWAEQGNLAEFWSKTVTFFSDHPESFWRWFFRQVYGLSQAVDKIHEVKLSPQIMDQHRRTSHSCGIHGDIKPQNILCFGVGPEPVLKLSDFGLTIFREEGNTGRQPDQVPTSGTYDGPEKTHGPRISRPFDIWSLGCVFLEFATWMLQGYKGIIEFSDKRLKEDKVEGLQFCGDHFFNSRGEVRVAVKDWIQELMTANGFFLLQEFLVYVRDRMIINDPEKRTKCGDMRETTKSLFERATSKKRKRS
ncbi:kinase-like protein [Thozetella sp. PMI_491]|nr:kinase-like protein [Thozetella sp. PMI_491]